MLVRRPSLRRAFATLTFTAGVLAGASCKDTSGPATAVTLTLHSVDGVVVPVQLRTAGGQLVTLARGLLQGTNWGHACGFAAGLAEGPLTTVAVPDCRLSPGEERTFDLMFGDVRFPSGTHSYRFVPE